MSETEPAFRQWTQEEIDLDRSMRAAEIREFCILMWRQNPHLAKQGGKKVRELLASLEPRDDTQ
jgi:hypothetical protein